MSAKAIPSSQLLLGTPSSLMKALPAQKYCRKYLYSLGISTIDHLIATHPADLLIVGFAQEKDGATDHFMNDVTPNLLGIDERVVLGWLPADKELVLSDLNTAETIANVLAYVILRSELRQIEREEKATRKQR